MSVARAASAVDRYLSRLRARAIGFLIARAIAAAVGAGSIVLALGALAAGPLAPAWSIPIVWIAVASLITFASAVALRPIAGLRGGRAALLLAGTRDDLVSPLRTAYELGGAAPVGASNALVRAHAEKLQRDIASIAPAVVVKADWLRHRTIALGILATMIASLVMAMSDRASAGAWALFHPMARAPGGVPIAAAFDDVEARLVFPSYLARPSLTIGDPSLLEVPVGTTIEMRSRTRIETTGAELMVAGASVRMEREHDRWVARFLARADSAITMRLRGSDGVWVRDATARAVRVIADETPRVTLILPALDATVEGNETIGIAYEVSDDVGVVSVDLVVRGGDGQERRRRIDTPEPGVLHTRGDDEVALAELGAQPGDRVQLFVEARDGDDVSGPHIGQSEIRTLTIASDATRREEALDALEDLVARAVGALADRLDEAPPADAVLARTRFSRMRVSTEALLEGLDAFARRARGPGGRAADAVMYSEASQRVRRLFFEELRMHALEIAPVAERARLDQRANRELEDDVLMLADLLTRARIDDAAAIARELESLRREISGLLQELRRADTPEARAALLAAIARAEQRLRDLRERMSRLGAALPQEFANVQETEARETQEALASMREALERGDLDAAAQALTRLEQQIDALARALGASSESFAEERFGPRDRAIADALDRLLGLEAEQRELARRTTEIRGSAARRALESADANSADVARRLTERAREARSALSPIDPERLTTMERDAYDSVVQRLRDTEDALATGDLGEASGMVETASQQLEELARDLELDSMMFPGHEGQTGRSSRAATAANRSLGTLRAELDEALPELREHLAANESGQMTGDVPRQRGARGAASDIASAFEHGPDGAPLAPDAAQALAEIGRLMDDGAAGLERRDPASAARAQEEAARRLTELRESIEQQMQQSSGGGGGGEDGSAPPDFRREVHIHDPGEFEGPMELRRRLLDAMRETPPAGYEESVQRYYEGLLR